MCDYFYVIKYSQNSYSICKMEIIDFMETPSDLIEAATDNADLNGIAKCGFDSVALNSFLTIPTYIYRERDQETQVSCTRQEGEIKRP